MEEHNLNKILDNRLKVNYYDLVNMLEELGTVILEDVKKDFKNILKYSDLIYFINTFNYPNELYVDKSFDYFKGEVNFDVNIKKELNELSTKLNEENDYSNLSLFFDYIKVLDYKDINSNIYNTLIKIAFNFENEKKYFPDEVAILMIKALTYDHLKKMKIENANVCFVESTSSFYGLCESDVLSKGEDDLKIMIGYNMTMLYNLDLISILEVVFHELRHAYFASNIESKMNYHNYNLLMDFIICNYINKDSFNYHYSKTEIDANIFSIVNTYKYMKMLYPNFSKKYLENSDLESLNLDKKNNFFYHEGKLLHFQYIFKKYISDVNNFDNMSSVFPIINLEYKKCNNIIVRKSSLELIEARKNSSSVEEQAFLDRLINERYMTFKDLYYDGLILLYNKDKTLDEDVLKYLNGSYLTKLNNSIDSKMSKDEFYLLRKMKEEIKEYNEKRDRKAR